MFLNKKINILLFIFFLATQLINAKHFVLIAKPGSGKGTFSQYMVEKYGYFQICAGDLFRNEILQQTDLGKRIESIVAKGEYVDEDTTCELMKKYLLSTLSENKNFILDGFPRSEYSFNYVTKFFEEQNIAQDLCFVKLDVSDEVCLERILGRTVCNTCFKVYNRTFLSSCEQEKCQKCGDILSIRSGDKEEVILKRLKHFSDIVEPIFQKAAQKYAHYIVNADQSLLSLYGVYDALI